MIIKILQAYDTPPSMLRAIGAMQTKRRYKYSTIEHLVTVNVKDGKALKVVEN